MAPWDGMGCNVMEAESGAAGDVLIVDDLADNRLLLRRRLTRQGYTVREAGDAERALEMIAENPPDIVLLDVMLPGMNGYEACRLIKQHRETSLLPVIIITSLESRHDRIQSIESGADEFLSKPVNQAELLARVRSLLRLQETRRELESVRLAAERRKQEHIRAVFSRYLNAEAVSRILEKSEEDQATLLQIRDRQDTVILFADLRGFTAMSESLAPPDVVAILNRYFTMLIRVAHQHEGTPFSMAGDSLLVGFGVRGAGSRLPAEQALLAAADMQRDFRPLADAWQRDLDADVGLGIGVNRGDVIVGNIGSAMFLNYTMIGDAVNVAARIESRAGRGEILCTGPVRNGVGEEFALGFTPLDSMHLKGKAEPVPVFRVEYRSQ